MLLLSPSKRFIVASLFSAFVFAVPSAFAQSKDNNVAAPGNMTELIQKEMERAKKHIQEASEKMKNIDLKTIENKQINGEFLLNQSGTKIDLEALAAKGRQIMTSPDQLLDNKKKYDFIAFVSLDMPKEALIRIAQDMKRHNGAIAIRGFYGKSMMETTIKIKEIWGDNIPEIAIHPEAFKQFSIEVVPAYVIARADASSVMENGCAPETTFTKVTGDVTAQYALEYMEKHSRILSGAANEILARANR